MGTTLPISCPRLYALQKRWWADEADSLDAGDWDRVEAIGRLASPRSRVVRVVVRTDVKRCAVVRLGGPSARTKLLVEAAVTGYRYPLNPLVAGSSPTGPTGC